MIKDLYAAGCRNLQFDDCTWGMIVDDNYLQQKLKNWTSFETEAEKFLKVNNLALEGKPADMVISTHICRGNYNSCYASSGAYDRVAPYVFAQENVDAFYLEYDDERSGSFEALKYIPKHKKVVLGLITTKRPELEDKDFILARIKEAATYFPIENLCLSPQCGMISGQRLTLFRKLLNWLGKRIDLKLDFNFNLGLGLKISAKIFIVGTQRCASYLGTQSL